jgi:phage terminase large subunit
MFTAPRGVLAAPSSERKITVGMTYAQVNEILNKSNWQKIDEKKEYDPHPAYRVLYKTVRYKVGTSKVPAEKSMIDVVVTLRFANDTLSVITKDFRNVMPSSVILNDISVD